MPDFGLSAALEAALKGAREAKVSLPGEAELAARAAGRSGGDAAQAVKVQLPDLQDIGAPDAGPVPKVSIPAPEQPPAPAATPVGDVAPSPAAGLPADPGLSPVTSDAAPASAAQTPPGEVLQPPNAPKPADPASPTAPKADIPSPANPPPSLLDATAKAPDTADIQASPPKPTEVEESAAKIAKADMGDFALDASHMPNFDRMTTMDQVKATIAQLAEDNKAGITEARRDVITNTQLQGLVNDIPGGDAAVIRQVLEREQGTALSPEVTLAARQFEQASAARITALAQQIQVAKKAGGDTDELLAQYARQKQLHVQFAEQLMGSRAEQGRGLQAFSIPVGAPPEVMQRLAEILKASNPNLDQELSAVSLANTAQGVASIVAGIPQGSLLKRIFAMSVPTSTGGTTPGAIMGFINRVFVNGILSSAYTWLKIGVGNTFNLLANNIDIGAAAVVGKFLSGEEHVQIGEMMANMHGNISATNDAFRMAYRILKTGESLGSVVRFAEGAPQDTNRVLPEINGTTFGKVMHVVDQVINAPGNRFVSAVDAFNQTLAYRGYLERQAYVAVNDALSSGTLAEKDAAAFVTKQMNNPDPAMQQAAQAWAMRMSFQDPLGESGQAITDWLQKNPAARLIVPFMRTSVNIFKQSIGERTPLALFTQRFQQALAAGGPDRDMAIGRMVTGSMFTAAIARKVLSGEITGAGPQDPKSRAVWESDGRRPYSISTLNQDTGTKTWHSLANFEPLATLLGTTADAIEIGSYIHADDTSDSLLDSEGKWKEAVSHVVVGVVNNTVNKTYMQGILKFSEMLSDPSRGFDNWKNQMVAGLDPFSGMQRLIRDETDPYMRQANTLLDTIKNQTPWVSKTLPTVKDIYGNDRLVKGGSVLGPMSPIPDSVQPYDMVTRELVAVMNATRTVPISMPDRNYPIGDGSGRGVQGGTSMRLTDREYAEYVDMARAAPGFDGKTFKEHLQEVIDSPTYQGLSDSMRAEALAAVANAVDKNARYRLLQENPDFAERHSQVVAQKNQIKFPQ